MSQLPEPETAWVGGALPANVLPGEGTRILGPQSFARFRSRAPGALIFGRQCTMEGVQFAVGLQGRIHIGDQCCFTGAILMCESRIDIGRRVLIGWNVTIADTDFHPLDPAARVADAIACSPAGGGRQRPPVACAAVRIGDDVWIGPNASIFKGVTVGNGAWIEAGAMVTRDVPARTRVAGNPARVTGDV